MLVPGFEHSGRLPAINELIAGRGPGVLVELGVVEQRYAAVLEVLNDGASATDVTRRCGVAGRKVHVWMRRYASQGLAGLVDGWVAGGRGWTVSQTDSVEEMSCWPASLVRS